MKWHDLCVVVNNGYSTVCFDGFSIVLDKNIVVGDFNPGVFAYALKHMSDLRDKAQGACVADIEPQEYTAVSEVLMSDAELVIMGKINDVRLFIQKPGKHIHCMVPGYVMNRFITPGENMIGVYDGKYVYIDNERFSVIARRYTTC